MVTTPIRMGLPSIGLIGAGRVGSTLVRALHRAGYPITAVWSRTPAHAAELADAVGASVTALKQTPEHADLTLIAVSDDSLAGMAPLLLDAGADLNGRMLVHCSGVHPADTLAPAVEAGALIGGLHPLAAIAERGHDLPAGITFAVEAAEPLRAVLWQMANDMGGHPFDLQPGTRPLYHAAAVIASNYTVVLAALANALLERAGVADDAGLRALLPLLSSTLANLHTTGLPGALTGPLVRGDIGTVEEHLAALDLADPAIAEVYRTLATAALPLVAARGDLDPATFQNLETILEGVRGY